MHKVIKAANELGCFVGLYVAIEKGKAIGASASLLSLETGNIQMFQHEMFIGANETEAMDKLYQQLKEAIDGI